MTSIIQYMLETVNANPGLTTKELVELFYTQKHEGKGPLLKEMTIASYLQINKTYKQYFVAKLSVKPGSNRPVKTWYLSDLGLTKLSS